MREGKAGRFASVWPILPGYQCGRYHSPCRKRGKIGHIGQNYWEALEYGFGRLIDRDRAEPVAKHGRPVVVVMAVEEFEQLEERALAAGKPGNTGTKGEGQEADREDVGVSIC